MNQKTNAKYLAYILFALFGVLFLPFWKPIVTAGIFALFLQPILARSKKTKIIPQKWVISSVVLTTIVMIMPFILGIYYTSSQVLDYARNNQDPIAKTNNLTKTFSAKMSKTIEKMGIPASKQTAALTEKMSNSLGNNAVSYSTLFITEIPDVVLSMIVFTLMLYVFLTYQSYIKDRILEWKVISRPDLDELITVLQNSSSQCFSSLFIVGLVQSTVVVIGALIAGFSKPVLIFLTTFVLSFIPIIGAAPMAFLLAAWEFVDGSSGMGILLIVTGCLAGTIDNVLKPILVKSGVEMDACITLVSIIGAIIIFGLPGLFIGPILATTTAHYFHKGSTP